MTRCRVHGNSIGKEQGPGHATAKSVFEAVSEAHADWNLAWEYDVDWSIYTADDTVTYDALKAALQAELGDRYLYSPF